MAGSINKVILIGNLGKDPEVRHLESGVAVCNFSIATGETYKDKNSGEKVTHTEWHNIVVFNKNADFVTQHLDKGHLIYVEGSIRTRVWLNAQKKEIKTTEVIVSKIVPL